MQCVLGSAVPEMSRKTCQLAGTSVDMGLLQLQAMRRMTESLGHGWESPQLTTKPKR